MAILINSDRTWTGGKSLDEWLIRNEAELEELPDTVGPGSVAFTADLSYAAMMDEDGEWQEIKAAGDAEEDEETTSSAEE